MSTTLKTLQRRTLQVLWSKLDDCFSPFFKQGIILAISGGPDSRALLESVACWPPREKCRFVVAVINHGVRQESQSESQLVAMRARRLGFLVHQEDFFNTGLSSEKDLRQKRYQALSLLASNNNCNSICTAHHRDDNAEGFLMSLTGHGGGKLGEAMKEIGRFEKLFLLRPFLSLSKAELLLPLSLLNQTDYAHDSLDEAMAGKRALLRHEILPSFACLGSNIRQRLDFFSQKQLSDNQMLQSCANLLINWSKDDTEAEIDLKTVKNPYLIEQAIINVLKKWGGKKDLRSGRKTLDQLIKGLNLGSPGLDHHINLFKVKDLREKVYFFVGARVIVTKQHLIIKRH